MSEQLLSLEYMPTMGGMEEIAPEKADLETHIVCNSQQLLTSHMFNHARDAVMRLVAAVDGASSATVHKHLEPFMNAFTNLQLFLDAVMMSTWSRFTEFFSRSWRSFQDAVKAQITTFDLKEFHDSLQFLQSMIHCDELDKCLKLVESSMSKVFVPAGKQFSPLQNLLT